jgi:hypothetical protein
LRRHIRDTLEIQPTSEEMANGISLLRKEKIWKKKTLGSYSVPCGLARQ